VSGRLPEPETVLTGIRALDASVTGRAIVVHDFAHARHVPSGRIVVAARATPEAILVMDRAIGLVFETGGSASHAAILARELGCPCMVGVDGALEAIEDGSLVTIDASRGQVRVRRG
jgi:phosphohistidine swiveling domain-containing protein